MVKTKKVYCALFFFCVIIGVKTIAQKNPYNEVSIASPTAGSLGKYADIPVSYHTGIPQISIPIYTVKEGPLNLPISLSYHASGLKVMETASWVGAGWSLNAGGVITRTVQGAPDERQTSNTYNQTHGHLSDAGYNQYFWVASGPPYAPLPPAWYAGTERQDWPLFAEGKKDGEPDLFFFNFAGYSGKFYFHDDGSATLVPEQDIKIEYAYTPSVGNSIESFTMTTPDGTKFKFGKTAPGDITHTEKTNPFNGDGGLSVGTAVSSWYLNRVSSADDLFNITLNYASENYSYYTTSMFPIPFDSSLQGFKPVKNLINGVRLSQILYSNGKVDFIPSTVPRLDLNGSAASLIDDANTEAKSLQSIQITNSAGTTGKKFDFDYSYFEDNTSVLAPSLVSIITDKKRLKLNSLQEKSLDGSIVVPSSVFEYFSEALPRRLSFAQDHWGFVNSATSNTTLIPMYTVNTFTSVPGADREAAWPAMRAGSLKKITYPTGGTSELEFEPNYTWVDYPVTQWQYQFNVSAGYDGNPLPVSQNKPFTSNLYRVTFSNSAQGSQATLKIFNSSNAQVKGYVLEAGQSYSETFQLAMGTYRVEITKLAPVSGTGTQANFEELATTNLQQNKMVGGLRLKSMTVFNGIQTSDNMVTSYTYEIAGKSTGILYSRPTYVYKVRNDINRDIGYQNGPNCSPQGCVDCFGAFYMKSPSGIRPMETTQGNHIGYNEVKVSQANNGYTIYRYYGSNQWDLNTGDIAYRSINPASGICEATINNFPFTPLSHEFLRGELKYEGHFNQTAQLLKEAEYYPVFVNSPKTTPAFIATFDPKSGGYLASFYSLTTAKKTQTQVIERTYSPGLGVIQNSNFSYLESPYHNQVTRTSSTTSTGLTLETKTKYAMDFRLPSCEAISDCLATYDNALASGATLYNSRKSACSDHSCRWWAWQAYIKDLSTARINYIACRKTNFTNPVNSFKTAHDYAKTTQANSDLKPLLELQDKFINAAIENSTWSDGKLVSAGFTKYDYVTIPANHVYPSIQQSLNVTSLASAFTPSTNSNTSLTKDSRYKNETMLKFSAGNIVEVQKKDGKPSSYIWDYVQNFPIAQVEAATVANIAYTSFEADGSGTFTYAVPKTADINCPSGKYYYELTSGAIGRAGLTSTQIYILSYWTKAGASITVSAGTQSNAITGATRSGWTYKQVQFTGASSLGISGAGAIDEVRLYPLGSQMQTYSYDSYYGLSNQIDANGKAIYYDYDKLARLINIKDHNRNLLKNYFYNFIVVP